MLMAEDILQNESSKDRRSHNVQREILGRAGKHTIIHIFAEYEPEANREQFRRRYKRKCENRKIHLLLL